MRFVQPANFPGLLINRLGQRAETPTDFVPFTLSGLNLLP